MVGIFDTFVLQLFEDHVPLKRLQKKSDKPHWITYAVEKAMVERDLAEENKRAHRTLRNIIKFRKKRNEVVKVKEHSKKRFWYKTLNSAPNAKKLWQGINELGIKPKEFDKCSGFTSDEFNDFFISTLIIQIPLMTYNFVVRIR